MRNRVVLGLLFAFLSQAGCGSSGNGTGNADGGGGSGGSAGGTSGGAGSGGSSGGAVTSLPGSTSLGSLTSAQGTQLCADGEAYFNAHISTADQCKLLAVGLSTLSSGTTDADVRSFCASFYTTCTSSGPTDSCDPTQFSTCAPSATVAEFSTCFADNTTATKQLIAGLPSCDTLTVASLASLNLTVPTPASCTQLLTQCPDLNTGN